MFTGFGRKSSFQPATNTVSRNGIADFLGDREAEACAALVSCRRGAFPHLDQERGRRRAPATAYGQKFGARFQGSQRRNSNLQRWARNLESGPRQIAPSAKAARGQPDRGDCSIYS